MTTRKKSQKILSRKAPQCDGHELRHVIIKDTAAYGCKCDEAKSTLLRGIRARIRRERIRANIGCAQYNCQEGDCITVLNVDLETAIPTQCVDVERKGCKPDDWGKKVYVTKNTTIRSRCECGPGTA